jgi:hypothetical protein
MLRPDFTKRAIAKPETKPTKNVKNISGLSGISIGIESTGQAIAKPVPVFFSAVLVFVAVVLVVDELDEVVEVAQLKQLPEEGSQAAHPPGVHE